jgi:hypothetical protein
MNTEEGSELICRICFVNKLPFLEKYLIDDYIQLKPNPEGLINNDDKRENVSPNSTSNKKRKFYEAFPDELNNINSNKSHKEIDKDEEDAIIIHNQEKENGKVLCKLKSNPSINSDEYNKYKDNDVFINLKKFYEIICKCSQCVENYKELKVDFMVDNNFIQDWTGRILIEDKLCKEAEENNKENQNFVSQISEVNIFNSNKVRNLPVEKVILFLKIN